MFMAELKNYLLTAGHDLDAVEGTVTLDIASGEEMYTKLNHEAQVTKTGDMMVSDSSGVLSSIIYGPDFRTRITKKTQRALFVVYGPAGVSEQHVRGHLQDIFRYIQLFSASAKITQSIIFHAD